MLAFLLLYAAGNASVYAIQASPHVIHETQPDGTRIQLHIHGSEQFHWHGDLAGFTVLRDKGRHMYTRLGKDQRLAPTTCEVGKAGLVAKGLKKRILPPGHIMRQLRAGSYSTPAVDEVNLDSEVNTMDVLLVQRALLDELFFLTDEQQRHADVAPLVSGMPAADGVIGMGDVLVIQRRALGL